MENLSQPSTPMPEGAEFLEVQNALQAYEESNKAHKRVQSLYDRFNELRTIEEKHKFVRELAHPLEELSTIRECYIRLIANNFSKMLSNLQLLNEHIDRLASEEDGEAEEAEPAE